MSLLVECVAELVGTLFEGLFRWGSRTPWQRRVRTGAGLVLLAGLAVGFVWWRNR